MPPPPIALREQLREERFNRVWTRELNDVFADVAPYYDRANYVASLGLWGWFLRAVHATVDVDRASACSTSAPAPTPSASRCSSASRRSRCTRSTAAPRCSRSDASMPRDAGSTSTASSTTCTRCRYPDNTSTSSRCSSPRAICASGACSRKSGACSSPAGASTTATCCGRATARREALLRVPALLPVVYRVPVPQRACGAQLQEVLHSGAADVLLGAGALRHARGRRLLRRDGRRPCSAGMLGFHRAVKPGAG